MTAKLHSETIVDGDLVITTNTDQFGINRSFRIETETYSVSLRVFSRSVDNLRSKTRGYVSGQEKPSMPLPAYDTFDENGERVADDAGWRKYNRAEMQIMRKHMTAALAATEPVFDDRGLKFSFSRKAGCSMCPCSPGFVFEGPLYWDGYRIAAIDVKVK